MEEAKNVKKTEPFTASAKAPAVKQKSKENDEKDKNKFKIIKEKVMVELSKFFRPELINRFDEVIVFEPLRFQDMVQIVKLQLKGIIKLIEDQDMGFAYTEEVIQEVVKAGFDPIYGARPLRRALQKMIENPISNLIIEGKVKSGDLIRARVDKGDLVFEVEKTIYELKVVKHYRCQGCSWEFENEVVKNSTMICPKCLRHGKEILVVEENKPIVEKSKEEEKPVEVKPVSTSAK
jgi:ATP-dependent protease Clp ATPase subunit